jgi:predicted hydrocarbon binding protein
MQPALPIDVDAETGVWTTDGLPMLYVPRHFFTNNHVAVEAALGRARYAEILYPAGYRSAHFWCAEEAETHGLAGLAVFEHYLNRLSQRGWGQFSFESADAATGNARIALRHSAFVLQQPGVTGRLCYMFEGWFAGAMDWVGENTGQAYSTVSREVQCAAEGFDHCTFSVTPKPV